MQSNTTSLWRNAGFLKLWFGQSISLFGSSITTLAIPLAAVTQLNATPTEMGLLQMAQYAPFLLFGLLAGVWVDRLARRPLLIVADLGRAAALAVVPLAALGGWLNIATLALVVFVVGTFSLLFEAAYAAFLPELVPTRQLGEGNSRLQASGATAEIAGPGLAGWLVQWLSAPVALLGDAVSFLVSAFMLLLIRVDEVKVAATVKHGALRQELFAGLKIVMQNAYIRALTMCSCTANIFINMHLAIYVLYLSREIGFSPAEIGLLYSASSVGALLGALSANRMARWLSFGGAIVGECIAVGLAAIAIPLFSMLGPGSLPLLALAHAVWGYWTPVYVVNAASLRQVVTPNHLLGRVTASSRFVSWGASMIGFLVGGLVAEQIGLLTTLIIAGVGLLVSSLWIILSPVRTLPEIPAPVEEALAA